MSVKVPDARKKKKPRIPLKSPLPVPLLSGSVEQKHCLNTQTIFRGFFLYGAVIIENDTFAEKIWENGFFGDGSLSSSGLRYKAVLKTRRSNEQTAANKLKENSSMQKSNEAPENRNTKITHSSCSLDQAEVMKRKPQDEVKEVLHLSLEEAFFLSYALGTLVLEDESRCEMDIDTMWDAFCKVNYQFPLQYAVYHHFRCKGWVVKPGTKFGTDWVLYPVGPPFYHSQYLVWVQCLWKETLDEDFTLSSRRGDVATMSALERLSGHVAKTLLLCQVLRPSDLTEDSLKSVECLRRFVISEVILQRWRPKNEMTSTPSPDAAPSPSSSKGFSLALPIALEECSKINVRRVGNQANERMYSIIQGFHEKLILENVFKNN